ncbi:MAG: translational GTPase TypA, partial [Oscillospiraceae bacterium]|nr:translational GTPase TypA [Oscillospiraceae bacterium]
LLKQSGLFRSNETVIERMMDSNDLERERGITILSKNTAIHYNDVKINIVDTPGHADFGGEVERIMMMVDGVLLLVDAFEGCMPQTRFVLKKALGLGKKVLVVVNKIDRPGARPAEVIDEALDLFIELGAEDAQLEFPVVYASARDGYASPDPDVTEGDMRPLLDAIIKEIDPPRGEPEEPLQLLISSLEYDDYVGRIGVGRVERGGVRRNQLVLLCSEENPAGRNVRVTRLYQFDGLKRVEVEEASLGDIVCVAGIENLNIGETLCDADNAAPLPFIQIDEPTISMNFIVNDSPFAGTEGKFVTSRNIRDRLFKEVETNVSMRVEETDTTDAFKVSGRGELHLSILIETMRRQGYELQVSRPKVITKEIGGKLHEPMELLIVEVPQQYVGVVIEKLGSRKAELENMGARDGGATHLEFKVPSRGLIGYRTEFLTDTNGNGIMNQLFAGYEPWKGDIAGRERGSIVSHETGESTAYGLFNAQERGRLFLGAGVPVYEGMVCGESARNEDLVINVCKKKQLTNTRASGSDDALRLTPPTVLSLEQCMEFIQDDELLEVTPKSLRLRKRQLNKEQRMKASSRR